MEKIGLIEIKEYFISQHTIEYFFSICNPNILSARTALERLGHWDPVAEKEIVKI